MSLALGLILVVLVTYVLIVWEDKLNDPTDKE